MMYVSLITLNLYSAVCSLYPNKTGRKKNISKYTKKREKKSHYAWKLKNNN